jgi:hypothetical protein
VGCGGMDWTELTQDKDRWQALVEFLTSCKPVSFSRRTLLHGLSILLLKHSGEFSPENV